MSGHWKRVTRVLSKHKSAFFFQFFPLFVLMLCSNNRRQLLAPGCWRMILWGWDFVWPLFFVAFLGPVSSQRFQTATRGRYAAAEGRWKRRVGMEKKVMTWDGANIFGIQILAPQMHWKSLSPCSVFLVLFLSKPRQMRARYFRHTFMINCSFVKYHQNQLSGSIVWKPQIVFNYAVWVYSLKIWTR